jgi:nucleotide-binding universal stress UspA family protein
MRDDAVRAVERFTTVVVPLDLTPTSDRALPVAAALADAAALDLVLVTTGSHGLESIDEAELGTRMSALAGRPADGVVIETDDPATALTDFVRSNVGALVCLASHGRTALGDVLFGSMTNEFLVRHAGPVLAVGPHVETSDFKTDLLVCVDEYAVDHQLIPFARAWTSTFRSDMALVEVVTPSTTVRVPEPDELRTASEAVPNAAVNVIPSRDPVAAILDEATSTRRIVAVAPHERDGLWRAIRGSVAHEVIRWSPTPTLLVCP